MERCEKKRWLDFRAQLFVRANAKALDKRSLTTRAKLRNQNVHRRVAKPVCCQVEPARKKTIQLYDFTQQ